MANRYFSLSLCLLLVLSGVSCSKTESGPGTAVVPAVPSPDTVARVYWKGKREVGIEAGAYYLMRIWNLNESSRLEAQTLDKLSVAPWLLRGGGDDLTSTFGPLLRTLLKDVVQEESYLEMRQAANQSMEVAFAVKVNEQQAGTWRTNLVAVIASLTGVQTMDVSDGGQSWSLRRQEVPNHFQLVRAGDWTVVGVSQDQNGLLGELVSRVKRDRAPYLARATNWWFEADIDLKKMATVFPSPAGWPGNLPKISVGITGDGANVLSLGELKFPEPLAMELEPWNIPTNLIHEPLAGFTAIRGVKPWLTAWKLWQGLPFSTVPNQACFWSLEGMPSCRTYVALPLADASNEVQRLTGAAMDQWNPRLASNNYVGFERAQDLNGVTWGNISSVHPFIKHADGYVVAGLLPEAGWGTNAGMREELLAKVMGTKDLVFYEEEMTAPQLEQDFNIGQLARVLLQRPQISVDSASVDWLRTITARLGNAEMIVTHPVPNRLSFLRRSTVGFTAGELQLLADWLESPRFPHGSYTTQP